MVLEDTADTTKKKVEPAADQNAGNTSDHKDPKTGADQTKTADGKETQPSKIESEGILCWGKDLFHEAADVFRGVFGNGSTDQSKQTKLDEVKAKATTVSDINSLTFDNCFGDSCKVPTADATKTTTPADATKTADATKPADGFGDWLSGTMKSAGDTVKGAFEWFFSGDSASPPATGDKPGGSQTRVEAKDGNVTADVTTKAGDHVVAHTKPGEQTVDANGVEVKHNKDGTTYNDGKISGGVDANGVKTMTMPDGTTAVDDGKTITIKDKTGKVIYQGDADKAEQTWKSTQNTTVEHPGTAADQAAKEQREGKWPPGVDTRIFKDGDGNFAVVRKDGMVIKTFKDGTIEIEKTEDRDHDGKPDHIHIRRRGHHVYNLVEDPVTHQLKEEPLNPHARMPRGVTVGDDGQVHLNGTQVVDAQGKVAADADNKTVIDTQKGQVTAEHGDIKITSGNGTSTDENTVTGCTTRHNQDGTDTVKTPGGEFTVDRRHHTTTAETPDHHKGVMGPEGVDFWTPENQHTHIGNDGSAWSQNADGTQLFNLDADGNLVLCDGTHIDADGHVYNDETGLDQYAFAGDPEAAQAIVTGVVSSSRGAIDSVAKKFGGNDVVTDADVSSLGAALGDCSNAIAACIASGNYDALAQVLAVQGELQGVLGTAQTLAKLYGDLRGQGLGNSEIAYAQRMFHGKTVEQAEEEAAAMHGNRPVQNDRMTA